MQLDVRQYKKFYYNTHLGAMCKRLLQTKLRHMWTNVRGCTVVGYGFAAPFLRPFHREAARTLCLMPAAQGSMAWPAEGPNVAALCAEDAWPLPDGLADRIVIAHALEHSAHAPRMFEEAVRLLAPGGRMIVVAPNRTGLWARRDQTPFGHGRPYSAGQMRDLLEACGLTVARAEAALFAAPSHRRYWLRAAPTLERLGRRFVSDAVAGALVIEAHKRAFARPKATPQHTPVFLPTPAPHVVAATRAGVVER